MIDPPRWTLDQLVAESERARKVFRKLRLEEPLQHYLDDFEQCQGSVEELFETTVDLTKLDAAAADVLTSSELLEAFRYLAGPPISADDLKTVAEASRSSLAGW